MFARNIYWVTVRYPVLSFFWTCVFQNAGFLHIFVVIWKHIVHFHKLRYMTIISILFSICNTFLKHPPNLVKLWDTEVVVLVSTIFANRFPTILIPVVNDLLYWILNYKFRTMWSGRLMFIRLEWYWKEIVKSDIIHKKCILFGQWYNAHYVPNSPHTWSFYVLLTTWTKDHEIF